MLSKLLVILDFHQLVQVFCEMSAQYGHGSLAVVF